MLKVFSKFQQGLSKTRSGFVDGVNRVVSKTRRIDENVLEELEELLILSDLGIGTTEKIIDDLRDKSRLQGASSTQEIINLLKNEMTRMLQNVPQKEVDYSMHKPFVISVVGVNGTGKTTSIGKLAHRFHTEGLKVILAAADTFRAAAIDQLQIWSARANVDIVHMQPGADPASVAFDASKAASARKVDILLIDTAGRLHTKSNLMAELSKIHQVLGKQIQGAPHEVLLILDATTGQNGLSQARRFAESANVTGLVVTKLDGTAKGGIIFPIVQELQIPVRYIGMGEKIDDLEEFDAKLFVEALFQ